MPDVRQSHTSVSGSRAINWQPYADDLVATGKVRAAAIISDTDAAVLALTPGLGLRGGEAHGIVDLSTNPAEAFGKGITVNAVKYMGVRADERSISGKRSAMRGQAPVSGGRMRLPSAATACDSRQRAPHGALRPRRLSL
ncbi:profilin [Streptomyces sp. NBC_00656]|uniref:profilin n=1 Tax=Streptomyces sp. NBC_00656 TaxID=2903668 RepID=UPI0032442595